jgi:hypothetical protein
MLRVELRHHETFRAELASMEITDEFDRNLLTSYLAS